MSAANGSTAPDRRPRGRTPCARTASATASAPARRRPSGQQRHRRGRPAGHGDAERARAQRGGHADAERQRDRGDADRRTGADGIARFPGLPAGDYAVSAAGGSRGASGLTAHRAAAGRRPTSTTAAPATLQGTVRDAGGQPVAGAHVLVTDADGRNQLVVTGADGRWSLGGLPGGGV